VTKQRANQGGARAIVVGLVSAKASDTEERLAKLKAALEVRGIHVAATLVQRRGVSRAKSPGGAARLDAPLSSATVIGKGKVEELTQLVKQHGASVVYFLNDLSTGQVARLSALIGCRVVPSKDSLG
jgi:50S ribosomal subunit-associated GTPase HflX